jgi:hypothetical protein
VEGRYGPYDATPVADLARKVWTVYERLQPESDPMLDFDERDLLRFAEEVGFPEVRLEVEVNIRSQRPRKWETYLAGAPNPKVPTLGEAIERALAPEEAQRFAAHLRPLVEHGEGTARLAVAYLRAVKR